MSTAIGTDTVAASGPSGSGVRRGLVLGCGGTIGAAWTVGALDAVADTLGWDPRTAEVIVGTSTGAELACLLGAGFGVDELLAAQLGRPTASPWLAEHFATPPRRLPPRPRPRLGSLRLARAGLRGEVPAVSGLAGLLPLGAGDPDRLARLAVHCGDRSGWLMHPRTWLVAIDYDSGERVAFGAPDAPKATLQQALLASWGVPGWYPPVTIDGRRYADGGIVSPTSADLVAGLGLDELVVLAPMASVDPGRARGAARIERLLRTQMSRRLTDEVATLERAGVRVLRIDPGPAELAAAGPNFMDGRRRLRTLESALRHCRQTVRDALASTTTTSRDAR